MNILLSLPPSIREVIFLYGELQNIRKTEALLLTTIGLPGRSIKDIAASTGIKPNTLAAPSNKVTTNPRCHSERRRARGKPQSSVIPSEVERKRNGVEGPLPNNITLHLDRVGHGRYGKIASWFVSV